MPVKLSKAIDLAGYGVITLSAGYLALAMGFGIRELRRQRASLSVQGEARYGGAHSGRRDRRHMYVLIPCLDEEAVIGQTVAALLGENTTVVVIDDGSSDRTGEVASAAGNRDEAGGDVVALRRELPRAQQGKGAALNHGIAHVRRVVDVRGQDPHDVIICVMDADGILAERTLSHVMPLFDDPRTGGVQLGVRIRNRGRNFLTWFQDYQFWALAAVTQFGRNGSATVSLGGNGQFTRLAALDSIGGTPWSNSLTEDLDLAISLGVRGWHLRTTPHTSVDQQGVSGWSRLVRQRTRWYQGHMTAIHRTGEIWRSPHLSHLSALEMYCYLLVPWCLDLPWSLLFQYCLVCFLLRPNVRVLHHPRFARLNSSRFGWSANVAAWYLLCFAPAIATSLAYLRRDRRVGLARALLLGHSFVVMNYLSFLCAWRALFRILRKSTGWAKTSRE